MSVVAITFVVIALAEVADTSGLVTLVLATRFPARWVLIGVFAGMLVHVGIAVAAGSLVGLLPERPLEAILAVMFLIGAALTLREGLEDEDDDDDDDEEREAPRTRWAVVATAFGITALSELADPSQILTATLTAQYGDPLLVGIGSLLGLWAVSALAIYGGSRLRQIVPVKWVAIVAAAIMVVLAIISAVAAIRG
ncbi:TMEM165/GDT1 family protein [Actinomycetospora straminea]|uniref:GDT1 family protein n=1 Tax=Actinomycetospora straminea TaxID=663607 RepID=A0ABP9F5R0_9PSEU|nr:TMEM165/GDT1 family protein [Actinomycetospora straminea]MDD7931640.1 TMEM165/GDT1 family protein [Actinomycetospora straminea]